MHLRKPTSALAKHATTLQAIPDGPQGINDTLRVMRSIVRRFKSHPEIRGVAMNQTRYLKGKDWIGEVKAVHKFVRENIRYLRDINGVETVGWPTVTLETGQGDCDDQSVLVASLLESIGHPTRFVAISFAPGIYAHVFTETKIGERWLSVETTEPVDVGWKPKGVNNRMVVYN